MASKAKPRPKRKKPAPNAPNPLANLGLFDIPNLDLEEDDEGSDVDEASLENELAALMAGEDVGRKKRVPKAAPPPLDIERLAADCMKDDDDDDDEEDLFANEELLKELEKLSPGINEEELPEKPPERKRLSLSQETSQNTILQQLEDRLKLYNDAIQTAKQMNDNSKVRRYGRAVKTLEGLIKSARGGGIISEEDIPPVVSIPKPSVSKKPDSESTSEVPKSLNDAAQFVPNIEAKPLPEPPSEMDTSAPSSLNVLLTTRKNEYKNAALQAKKIGNKELAIEYMRTAKAFDAVIEAANNGLPVDLSNLPPSLSSGSESITSGAIPSKKTEEQVQNQSSPMEIAALAAANDEEQPAVFAAPPPPSSVLECLEQRLEKYKSTKQAAESEGNSGKVRRLQRIVKTYETAIKDYKAGRKIDYDDLPCPPGFAPFPVEGGSASVSSTENKPKEPKVTPASKASDAPKPGVSTKTTTAPQAPARKPKVQRTTTFSGEKQLEFLLERQKLFRQAALSSKQEGNIQQAKEYLKLSKGFDSMIEAVKCGLPIDTTQIPTPPQLESTDFVIVDALDCEESTGDLSQEELFETLLKDLTNQLEICRRNKEHFLRLGDVTSASKFEKLALESKKDLSVVQHLKKTDQPVPKFHYETRLFSMVVCNTDLADNELEVTIERGINLPGKPDELDSYVKIEFPIPSEAPQTAKSHTIRDTNNPEFKETFKFEINRKSRSQLRLFKRHSIKLEVWSKGGFLRSDKLLGTVSVKLLDLESKCIVHDSYNLMEGRKNVGGSLEVKIRIRDPLIAKQVEEVREKWLIIGS